MKKRLSSQNAPGSGAGDRRAPGGAAAQSHPKKDSVPSASVQQPTEGSAASEKTVPAGGRTIKNEVGQLSPDLRKLVQKMLVEGSTFEDIVEAVNERGENGITLHAVQNYFQGNLEIQKNAGSPCD